MVWLTHPLIARRITGRWCGCRVSSDDCSRPRVDWWILFRRSCLPFSPCRFEAVPDEESGKLKAINVTRPGGEPIEPPASDKPRAKSVQGAGSRKSSRKQVDKPNRGGPLKKSPPTSEKNSADPPFHAVIKPSIKDQIQLRGLDLNVKSTVDIALGKSRFKLGQGGYAGYADADCNIGEGSYSCDEDGLVTFTWNRRLKFTNGTWVPDDPVPLPSSVSLQDGKAVECPLRNESNAHIGCRSLVASRHRSRLRDSRQTRRNGK
jgi:hypothetical protein